MSTDTSEFVINRRVSGLTLYQAYLESISEVMQNGHVVAAPTSDKSVGKGREMKEIFNLSIQIDQPRHRMFPYKSPRGVKIQYPLGAFMWILFEDRSLKFINHYNPKGKDFSDDGRVLFGAYGPRIGWQLRAVESLLRHDPNTRRAVVHVHLPTDLEVPSFDIPCPVVIHFIIRRGRLHMNVYMRSQSVGMVLPYDLMIFSLIHEYMSVIMGKPLGIYTHICGSAHIYEDDYKVCMEEMNWSNSFSLLEMPVMTPADVDDITLAQVKKVESSARNRGVKYTDPSNMIMGTQFWVWVGEKLGWWG